MPSVDRTQEFRQTLREKASALPEGKRRKLSRPSRRDPSTSDVQDLLGKSFVKDAHTLLGHITSIACMLANVRRPYLNTDARGPGSSKLGARTLDLSSSSAETWANIRYLTNEERDQIDLQARIILSRCADRVKELEALEKRRVELAASRTNPLARLLPSRLLPPDSSSLSSGFIAAHHASITWYLNRRLAEASEQQKTMQEERMKRQMERTKTLGSGAAKEVLTFNTKPSGLQPPPAGTIRVSGSSDSWFGAIPGNLASSFSTSLRGADSGQPSPAYSSAPLPSDLDSDSDSDEIELTQSQILQFETENAQILREVQDTLQSVQQAETRLLEISALQTELVTHLTQQTELTNQLFDDAIAATGEVEKGNVQLREAKRRGKDSRLFILVFLIGASMSLLFLHFY